MSSLYSTVPNIVVRNQTELLRPEYFLREDVCRLCWNSNADRELLPKNTETHQQHNNLLANKVKYCLDLDFAPDSYPKKMCTNCFQKVEDIFIFKNYCHDLEIKLEDILRKIPDTQDINTIQREDEMNYKENLLPTSNVNDIEALEESDNNVQPNSLDVKVCGTIAYDRKIKDKNLHAPDLTNNNICCFILHIQSDPIDLLQNDAKKKDKHLPVTYISDTNSMHSDSLDMKVSEYEAKNYKDLHVAAISDTNILHTTTVNKQSRKLQKGKKKLKLDRNVKSNVGSEKKKKQQTINFQPKASPTYCIICRRDLKELDLDLFTTHRYEAHGIRTDGRLKCFGCDGHFKNARTRVGHESRFCKALKDGYKCPLCDRYLPSRMKYEKHMRDHTKKKSLELPEDDVFKCKICHETLNNKESWVEHKMTAHVKKYVCETCGRSFNRRDNLCSHRLTHSRMKKHVCPHCNNRFSSWTTLVHHFRTHSDEPPYRCDICSWRSKSIYAITKHRRMHLNKT